MSVNLLQKKIEELKRERELLIGIVAREAGCGYCLHNNCIPCVELSEDIAGCENCSHECRCKNCSYGSNFEWNGKGVEDAGR